MFAVSQIIERNLHRRKPGGKVLWINPENDDCWRSVEAHCATLNLFSQDYGSYAFLKQTGANPEFSAFPTTGEKFDWVILNLPRQKALLEMLLDCAAAMLAHDGALWLAGENKAGIKSADKLLKLRFGQLRKLDNARHCCLFEAGNPINQDPFNPLNYREKWIVDCTGSGIEVYSYPGVFAHGRLDKGTSLLLEALVKIQPKGDVLDFASGAGVIGACIAARYANTRVTLLDAHALALRASEETLEVNGLKGFVLASDGLSTLETDFDLVVSNPPIHAGVKTDNHLGMRLLDSIREHIRPGGQFLFVANVHLPYEKWLSKSFKKCNELAANENYKVIVARK